MKHTAAQDISSIARAERVAIVEQASKLADHMLAEGTVSPSPMKDGSRFGIAVSSERIDLAAAVVGELPGVRQLCVTRFAWSADLPGCIGRDDHFLSFTLFGMSRAMLFALAHTLSHFTSDVAPFLAYDEDGAPFIESFIRAGGTDSDASGLSPELSPFIL